MRKITKAEVKNEIKKVTTFGDCESARLIVWADWDGENVEDYEATITLVIDDEEYIDLEVVAEGSKVVELIKEDSTKKYTKKMKSWVEWLIFTARLYSEEGIEITDKIARI